MIGLTKLLTLRQKDTQKHAYKYDCGYNKITQHNFKWISLILLFSTYAQNESKGAVKTIK